MEPRAPFLSIPGACMSRFCSVAPAFPICTAAIFESDISIRALPPCKASGLPVFMSGWCGRAHAVIVASSPCLPCTATTHTVSVDSFLNLLHAAAALRPSWCLNIVQWRIGTQPATHNESTGPAHYLCSLMTSCRRFQARRCGAEICQAVSFHACVPSPSVRQWSFHAMQLMLPFATASPA